MAFSMHNIVYGERSRATDYHYIDLEDDEHEKEGFLEHEDGAAPHRREQNPSLYTRIQRYSLPISALLLVLSSINLIVALYKQPTIRQCVERTSLWSPAFPAIQYHDFDFNNAFAVKSPYRGPPTKEREALWEQLYLKPAISIPPSKLPLLNRTSTPSSPYQRTQDGTSYKALLEVYHQLHCLNRIRQYTWYQSSSYDPSNSTDIDSVPIPVDIAASSEVANRMHIDHCIETLRHTLTCHGDVTPLLVKVDDKAVRGQSIDFETHHRCRDFGKIGQWVEENMAEL